MQSAWRGDDPGARFSKVPKTFRPEKPFIKLRPAGFVKLVFSYVVKGIETEITAKFRASRHPRCEDTKRIKSPEIRPKTYGTFEKWAPGPLTSAIAVITVGRADKACFV